jgi:hypothetical protein
MPHHADPELPMDDDKLFDENEEKPKIKVTDRRKFTADGELRPSQAEPADSERGSDGGPASGPAKEPPAAAPGSEPAEEPAAARASGSAEETAPAAGPAEDTAARATAGPEPAGAASAGDAAAAGGPAPSIADLPRDFTAFIEGMYLEAMLYLGALPDPRTGDTAEDLDMAKYKIDLLGMIQEKTRGNLSDEEAQQLEDVLYQLRMFFVQRSEGGGQ